MGSTAGTSSCFPSVLATTLLLLAATALATAPATAPVNHDNAAAVSPFCTSTTMTSQDDRVVCTQLVKGAETWPEAMVNAIKGVIEVVKAGKPTVIDGLGALLPPDMMAVRKQSICSTCRRRFDFYLYTLEHCIELMMMKNEDQTSELRTYLSATVFSFCVDALTDVNLSLPVVDQFNDHTYKLGDILLAILDIKPQN